MDCPSRAKNHHPAFLCDGLPGDGYKVQRSVPSLWHFAIAYIRPLFQPLPVMPSVDHGGQHAHVIAMCPFNTSFSFIHAPVNITTANDDGHFYTQFSNRFNFLAYWDIAWSKPKFLSPIKDSPESFRRIVCIWLHGYRLNFPRCEDSLNFSADSIKKGEPFGSPVFSLTGNYPSATRLNSISFRSMSTLFRCSATVLPASFTKD